MLGQFRAAGSVDSEGRFTLDPRRARELLREFQLAQPEYYILHLVSYAVAAGAQLIEVGVGDQSVSLTHDGELPTLGELESPFSALLSNDHQRHAQREFAIALNSLLANPDNDLRLTCPGAEGGWLAFYSAKEQRVEPLTKPTRGLRIEIFRSLQRSQRAQAEVDLLREHFKYCPAEVRVNGRAITESLSPGSCTAWLELTAEPASPATRLRVAAAPADYHERQEHALRCSALISVGGEGSALQILHLGRLYQLPLGWEFEGLELSIGITVATDRVKKDLSGGRLVEDQVLANLRRYLQQQTAGLLTRMVAARPRLELSAGLHPALEWVVTCLSRAGQYEQAHHLQTLLCQWWRDREGAAPAGAAFYRLGLLSQQLGLGHETTSHFELADLHWRRLGRQLKVGDEVVPAKLQVDWLRLEASAELFGQLPAHEATRLLTVTRTARDLGLPRLVRASAEILLANGAAGEANRLELTACLAGALFELRESDRSLQLYEAIWALGEPLDSSLPAAARLQARENYAVLLAEQGRFEAARDHLLIALSARKEQLGESAPAVHQLALRLSVVFAALGQTQESEQLRAWIANLQKA